MMIIKGIKFFFVGIISFIAFLLYVAFFTGMVIMVFIRAGYILYALYDLYCIWINNNSKISLLLILAIIGYIFVGFILFFICKFVYILLDGIVMSLSTATTLNYKIHCLYVHISDKLYYSLPGKKDKLARMQGFRNFEELQNYLHNN
mgnify:CR=1 FL=1|jgi:hypothetical protein